MLFVTVAKNVSDAYFSNESRIIQGGTAIRGGQRFANFYCTSFKTNISVLILKGPYSIEKCVTCLHTFLRF